MVCAFFGHRDTPPEGEPLLREVLLTLIEQRGVREFYVGHQGNFDAMARTQLMEPERSHGIRYAVVLAALPREKGSLPEPSRTVFPRDWRPFRPASPLTAGTDG